MGAVKPLLSQKLGTQYKSITKLKYCQFCISIVKILEVILMFQKQKTPMNSVFYC